MSERFDPAVIPVVQVDRVLSDFEKAELGQWYWVVNRRDPEDAPDLMCVMEIGSNYVLLNGPEMGGNTLSRVHRDEFEAKLTLERNADHHIRLMVEHFQKAVTENMAEIQRLTESLGIAPQLGHHSRGETEGKALAILSGQVDVDAFKNQLILAKKETLPKLFEQNKHLSKELGRWMAAPSMPLKAMMGPMKESSAKIEDRIFNITLYSGLLEEIITIADGLPAARDEKLRIMQRRLYCDEECLLDYESGGMEFRNMGEFDLWLAKPNNLARILPFSRCMVSMRVRRVEKDRSDLGLNAFVQIRVAKADTITYLFVRNGDQLYRICTEIDFGEHMFPARAVYDPSEPMMMKIWGSDRIEEMMPKRTYDHIIAEQAAKKALNDKWESDNPREQWEATNPDKDWWYSNPHRYDSYRGLSSENWQPFDDSSAYFDQGMQMIQGEIKEYNRIALIVQGLFDRTATLIPHQPVQMWKAASFAASVELIYDNSMALHWGEAPNIEAYVDSCNARVAADSVLFGQDHQWALREAERQNQREEDNWRIRSNNRSRYTVLRPTGDPGPGRVAVPAAFAPRSQIVTFTWMKESRPYSENYVRSSIKVPLDKLFNVSAYKLGDYLKFFTDPRTRSKYLEWAPMLLSAEDYHRGKLEAQQPFSGELPKNARYR
ncbi:hypothetical protein ACI77O_12635 [Pseudomonas tritici]|uniref:hypothetical protein n=1 Tax=Pseudomonas tritici TaxID=2745518 RepID=UPI00387B8958